MSEYKGIGASQWGGASQAGQTVRSGGQSRGQLQQNVAFDQQSMGQSSGLAVRMPMSKAMMGKYSMINKEAERKVDGTVSEFMDA